jgi:hypothetical protein
LLLFVDDPDELGIGRVQNLRFRLVHCSIYRIRGGFSGRGEQELSRFSRALSTPKGPARKPGQGGGSHQTLRELPGNRS